jgi:two-component system nitrogen regulation sensor histidine kinase NtrY
VLLTRYGSDEIAIVVTDSGLGLPKNENPIHLTEPYVTHKPKGTGLGLAIVKKIMEDHEGSLLLMPPEWLKSMKDWEDLQGAAVVLLLPARSVKDKTIAA